MLFNVKPIDLVTLKYYKKINICLCTPLKTVMNIVICLFLILIFFKLFYRTFINMIIYLIDTNNKNNFLKLSTTDCIL